MLVAVLGVRGGGLVAPEGADLVELRLATRVLAFAVERALHDDVGHFVRGDVARKRVVQLTASAAHRAEARDDVRSGAAETAG